MSPASPSKRLSQPGSDQSSIVTPEELPKGKTRKVVLSGWYGQGNLGDEIILQSIVFQLRSRIPNVAITVLSERPDRLRRELSLKGVRKTRRRLDSSRRILAISRANAFILGGGGILMDYGSVDTNVAKWLEDMKTAQRLHVPNMAWGVGVGKIWTERSKKWMKEVLPRADSVTVRDKESALTLHSLGIKENVAYSCDPALMLPDLHEFERKHSERRIREDRVKILVCLRHWYVTGNWTFNEQVFNNVKTALGKVLSNLSRMRGASITFVPMVADVKERDDDRVVEKEVRSLVGEVGESILIDHVPDSREFMQLLAESDLLIGMRLHSLILATAIGVPCVGISYYDKVKSFMSSIGAGDWALSMEEVNFENLSRLANNALNGSFPCSLIKGNIEMKRKNARAEIDKAVGMIQSERTWSTLAERYLKARALVLSSLMRPRKSVATLDKSGLGAAERVEETEVASRIPVDA